MRLPIILEAASQTTPLHPYSINLAVDISVQGKEYSYINFETLPDYDLEYTETTRDATTQTLKCSIPLPSSMTVGNMVKMAMTATERCGDMEEGSLVTNLSENEGREEDGEIYPSDLDGSVTEEMDVTTKPKTSARHTRESKIPVSLPSVRDCSACSHGKSSGNTDFTKPTYWIPKKTGKKNKNVVVPVVTSVRECATCALKKSVVCESGKTEKSKIGKPVKKEKVMVACRKIVKSCDVIQEVNIEARTVMVDMATETNSTDESEAMNNADVEYEILVPPHLPKVDHRLPVASPSVRKCSACSHGKSSGKTDITKPTYWIPKKTGKKNKKVIVPVFTSVRECAACAHKKSAVCESGKTEKSRIGKPEMKAKKNTKIVVPVIPSVRECAACAHKKSVVCEGVAPEKSKIGKPEMKGKKNTKVVVPVIPSVRECSACAHKKSVVCESGKTEKPRIGKPEMKRKKKNVVVPVLPSVRECAACAHKKSVVCETGKTEKSKIGKTEKKGKVIVKSIGIVKACDVVQEAITEPASVMVDMATETIPTNESETMDNVDVEYEISVPPRILTVDHGEKEPLLPIFIVVFRKRLFFYGYWTITCVSTRASVPKCDIRREATKQLMARKCAVEAFSSCALMKTPSRWQHHVHQKLDMKLFYSSVPMLARDAKINGIPNVLAPAAEPFAIDNASTAIELPFKTISVPANLLNMFRVCETPDLSSTTTSTTHYNVMCAPNVSMGMTGMSSQGCVSKTTSDSVWSLLNLLSTYANGDLYSHKSKAIIRTPPTGWTDSIYDHISFDESQGQGVLQTRTNPKFIAGSSWEIKDLAWPLLKLLSTSPLENVSSRETKSSEIILGTLPTAFVESICGKISLNEMGEIQGHSMILRSRVDRPKAFDGSSWKTRKSVRYLLQAMPLNSWDQPERPLSLHENIGNSSSVARAHVTATSSSEVNIKQAYKKFLSSVFETRPRYQCGYTTSAFKTVYYLKKTLDISNPSLSTRTTILSIESQDARFPQNENAPSPIPNVELDYDPYSPKDYVPRPKPKGIMGFVNRLSGYAVDAVLGISRVFT